MYDCQVQMGSFVIINPQTIEPPIMTQRHFSRTPTLLDYSSRIFCNSSDILFSISFMCFVVLSELVDILSCNC